MAASALDPFPLLNLYFDGQAPFLYDFWNLSRLMSDLFNYTPLYSIYYFFYSIIWGMWQEGLISIASGWLILVNFQKSYLGMINLILFILNYVFNMSKDGLILYFYPQFDLIGFHS